MITLGLGGRLYGRLSFRRGRGQGRIIRLGSLDFLFGLSA